MHIQQAEQKVKLHCSMHIAALHILAHIAQVYFGEVHSMYYIVEFTVHITQSTVDIITSVAEHTSMQVMQGGKTTKKEAGTIFQFSNLKSYSLFPFSLRLTLQK